MSEEKDAVTSEEKVIPPRNVVVYDYEGNTVSGFWQYGLIDWEEFNRILINIITTQEEWVFHPLSTGGEIGDEVSASSNEIVPEGQYVLLSRNGTPLKVELQNVKARPRNPTVPTTESRGSSYRDRVRKRDPYCVITRKRHNGRFDRFEVAHIFPRAHQAEWINRHFLSEITDPAPLKDIGGPSKIDSIQNVLLMEAGLHRAFGNYNFGINPDKNYLVVPFIEGYDEIAGKTLSLDHIKDANLRPLDNLLRDHFRQGIYKHIKGAGEPSWDYENTFGPGAFDLSQFDIWGTAEGQEQLETALANRLYPVMAEQKLLHQ